ncbi:MAG: glutaredoxin family protein [Thermoleophilia bacterium]
MLKHVEGDDLGSIMLYALSTCMWCRKTKQLLGDLHAAYDFIDVDLLDKAEQQAVTADIKKWNPDNTFPTVVINGETCIVGYEPDKIQAELHKWK